MFLIRVINLLKSIINLIFYNIIFFYFSKIKRKKVILFYFPIAIDQKSLLYFIKKLKKKKEYMVFLSYNKKTQQQIRSNKNSFFLNNGYLNFIYNVRIFISNYLVYNYPPLSKKIYINHDIYDTPMVDSKIEKDVFKKLEDLDYLFLSSEILIQYFKKKIMKYSRIKEIRNNKLLNTGYLKLDLMSSKLANLDKYKKKKNIIFAPTSKKMFENINSSKYIKQIIETVLSKTNFSITYRPHPLDVNTNKKKKKVFDKLRKFIANKNFSIDLSSSYFYSYKNSDLMITDFSGTSYTYSFSTLKPVIFFSPNEMQLKSMSISKLNFFKDRNKIGLITINQNRLIKDIFFIYKNLNSFKKMIKFIRKKRIKFFGKSETRTLKLIKDISENKI